MLTVPFGTRNVVLCEELVLSEALCSGLVLSAVLGWMAWSLLIRIEDILVKEIYDN